MIRSRAATRLRAALVAGLFGLVAGGYAGCATDSAAASDAHRSTRSHTSMPPPVDDSDATSAPLQLPRDLRPRGASDDAPAHPLARVYDRLSALEDGASTRVRIVQIGDSHTASDTFSGPVREALQARFGDSGRGYLFAGLPWSGYRQRDATYSMSRGWTGGVGIRGGGDGFGLGGGRVVTSRSGEWIERGPCRRCDGGKSSAHIAVHYLQQPDGGRFDVLIDGKVAAHVDSHSPTLHAGILRLSVPEGEHSLRIQTTTSGKVTLFGTSMESDRPGVTYDSLGINGAQLRQFLAFNEAYTQAELASLDPDLVILAFGANEAMSSRYDVRNPRENALELLQKLEVYRDEILALIERYRAVAPDAACLLLLPPDMLTRGNEPCVSYSFDAEQLQGERCVQQPPANYAGILNAQRYAAKEAGCAVWDQQHAMGGEGAMDIWRELRLGARDGVHLTTAGYSLLAEGFTTDLLDNYEAYRAGRPRPLETTVQMPELATSARPLLGRGRDAL